MEATLQSAPGPVRKSFRKALNCPGSIIHQYATESDQVAEFASSTAAGLSTKPRRLECRFLYDARGSELFDLITRQPEYYLTRTETEILAASAPRIRAITGPTALVELGSGYSVKTEHLLQAWVASGERVRYIPVDVSESALQDAGRAITARHSAVQVLGINSDYRGSFPLLRDISPVTVLFLGSSIGNFQQKELSAFLADLSQSLDPGDFFLLGVDLVKDRKVIEAAYNDAAGITRDFTRNLFVRMNRELGSAVDPAAIEHQAVYNESSEQVEICARFSRRQVIHIAPLRQSFAIDEAEAIDTEISRKFTLDKLLPFLEGFGFTAEEVFTDRRRWFALLLLSRSDLPVPMCGGAS